MSALGYKWKYDSPRHEWDPYISIIIFNKYHLLWLFNWIDQSDSNSNTYSMATWEAILDYLYNKIPEERLVNHHMWKTGIGEDAENITIEGNMK